MDEISSLILGVCLILIMLGMGLSLTVDDFKRVVKRPKAIAIGLTNQLILLPIIGFLLANLLDLEPHLAIGLMILAACPGGATSNLIAHLARGDTALSVSLTAVASLITIFSIPFIVQLALVEFQNNNQTIELNKVQMVVQLLAIVVVPVALGMLIRFKKEAFAIRMDRPVRKASGFLLALVTIWLFVKEREDIIPFFRQAGLATILLNISTITLGFTSARLARLGKRQGMSVAVESGIQNSALAVTIATITLADTSYGIIAAIYTLVMYASGFSLIFFGRRTISV